MENSASYFVSCIFWRAYPNSVNARVDDLGAAQKNRRARLVLVRRARERTRAAIAFSSLAEDMRTLLGPPAAPMRYLARRRSGERLGTKRRKKGNEIGVACGYLFVIS